MIMQDACDFNLYARPLIPLLFSFIAGIILGDWLPGYGLLALIPLLAAIFFIFKVLCHRSGSRFAPLILFASLGYLSIQPWVSPNLPQNHVSRFADGTVWKITGIIASPPVESNHRIKFVLETETLSQKGKMLDVAGKVRVTAGSDEFTSNSGNSVALGDRLAFEGRLRRPRNFHNPGGFDYERYMALHGIRATVYGRKGTFERLQGSSTPLGASRTIAQARQKIAAFFDHLGNGEGADILKALVVGDRTDIDPETRNAFNRAGASHLLAISGLHVGIVAAASFGLFSWVLAGSRTLLWRAWTRKGAALLTFFPVLCYGLLAGMSPSTQRAVIMVSLFLMALLVNRERDPMNILAAAALIILVLHPPALFSVSFQLSFAAVTAILYGLPRIESKQPQANGRRKVLRLYLPNWIRQFIQISLLAILGTTPLVALYFNQISFIGVLTNLIFIPFIGFLIVPAGLVTAAFLPFSDLLAGLLGHITVFFMEVALFLIRFFAALPISAAKTVTPSIIEIIIYYLMGIALLNWIWWEEGKQRHKAGMVCLVLAAAGLADAAYWTHRRFLQKDLRATVLDVGQGSAALVELPGGRCMLVDGGGFYDNDVFDVGKYLIAPYLWRNKIRTVDTLVLSHPNSDHLNGLLYIADHFNVSSLWTNGEPADTDGYRLLMETAQRKAIKALPYSDIQRSIALDKARIDILYPPADFMARRDVDAWRKDENNNSIVVKITCGDVSFLFPGDLGRRAERELIEIAGDQIKSDVLVAPHHGSNTSSSQAFLEAVDPDVIVISVGWKNRFNFPHESVLERYRQTRARIYRTDLHGAIQMKTEGHNLYVTPTSCLHPQAAP